MAWYGIWDFDAKNWVRELPSKVDDGGEAVLAFSSERIARARAAKHFFYDTYGELKKSGWAEVRPLASPAKSAAPRAKVVRK